MKEPLLTEPAHTLFMQLWIAIQDLAVFPRGGSGHASILSTPSVRTHTDQQCYRLIVETAAISHTAGIRSGAVMAHQFSNLAYTPLGRNDHGTGFACFIYHCLESPGRRIHRDFWRGLSNISLMTSIMDKLIYTRHLCYEITLGIEADYEKSWWMRETMDCLSDENEPNDLFEVNTANFRMSGTRVQ
jgi:hypothetical protein